MIASADALNESSFVPIEITDLKAVKIVGDLRWTGKAKFPGALRGKSFAVFQIEGELVAIPAFCPHEQANLSQGIFVEPWVLECPLHHNKYDLRTGVISTFKVELRGETPYLLWDKERKEAVIHTFASEVPVEKRSKQENVTLLEAEIVALGRAAQLREERVAGTIRQMDAMIQEVEEKRSAIEQANRNLTTANEFISRVTDAMREVLVVLDPSGRIKDANRRFYSLLGYEPAELRGQSLDRLLSAADLATLHARAAAQEAEFECDLLTKQGERCAHLLRTAVLYGPSGKKEGVVVVGTDIRQIKSAQRELATAYEKVTGLLDNMRQAVFVVLATGEIIEPVSRFSSTVFGCDLVGRHVFDVVYKDLDPKSEVFSLLQTAFVTTFGADDFQWSLMEEYFPKRLLYRPGEPGGKEEGFRILKVDYCPLRGPEGLMDKMMLVVEDITRLENLEEEIEREKQSNFRRIQIVEELARNSLDDLREFFTSAYASLREARQTAESDQPGAEARVALLRGLHMLKGNARMLGLRLVAQQVHEAEGATVAFVAASESSPGAGQAVRDALDAVQRQVAEYCHLAESVLHIPNDFDAGAHLLMHECMVDLDRTMTAWLGPPLVRMNEVDDVRVLAGAPPGAVLRRHLMEVRGAAAGIISDELHARIRDVESAISRLGADAQGRGEPVSRLRNAYVALINVVAARCTESNACPPYSLSRTRWVELFVALHAYAALALRAGAGGATLELARAHDAVVAAAAAIEEDYVSALFTRVDSTTRLSALREAWRHLACISVLESLAMVQHADRRLFLAACASKRDCAAEIARVLSDLRTRGGLFLSFLDAMQRRGYACSVVLGTLDELFTAADAGSQGVSAVVGPRVHRGPSRVARMFVSDRDLPNLDEVLAAFAKQRSPAAENALFAQLGTSGEIYRADDVQVSLYLKKVDVARQLRTVREVLSGNYQLLFERVQLLNVVAYKFHGLKRAIAKFKDDRTERAYAEIETALERLLDVPLVPALYRYYKMVADIAAGLSKTVDFRITGDDTIAVPREGLAVLQDALLHALRNAIDHGIESREGRESAGKSKAGRLEIECVQDGALLVITVRDDGRGIDAARVVERAIELGAITEEAAARLDPKEALDLVFLPGLSTARHVTDLSGRGVGMEIVRTALAGIGGTVELRSEPGKGTEVVLSIRQSA